MAKKNKIVRGKSLYRRGHISPVKILVIAALATGLFAVGWFLYEPIYSLIMGIDILPQEPSESSSDTQPDQSQSEQTVQPDTPMYPEDITMAYLPPEVVRDEQLLLEAMGELPSNVNALLIDIKDSSGILHYQSRLPVAASGELIAPEAGELAEVTAVISDAGYVVVGRVWAFEDHTAANYLTGAQVMYQETEYTWIDDSVDLGGQSWLNPYSELAQGYIADIVTEAMGMGVEGIVLDGVQFPTGVGLNLAGYGDTGELARSEVLGVFAQEIDDIVKRWDGVGCWRYFEADELMTPDTDELYGPYGGDVQSLVADAELMINVMPIQLGTGGDTLPAPVTTPGTTVDYILNSIDIIPQKSRVMTMLQAYTDPELASEFNISYTSQQIEEQTDAVNQWGARDIAYYNPDGEYSVLSADKN